MAQSSRSSAVPVHGIVSIMTDQPGIGRSGTESLRRGLRALRSLLLAAIAGAVAVVALAIARRWGSPGARRGRGPTPGWAVGQPS